MFFNFVIIILVMIDYRFNFDHSISFLLFYINLSTDLSESSSLIFFKFHWFIHPYLSKIFNVFLIQNVCYKPNFDRKQRMKKNSYTIFVLCILSSFSLHCLGLYLLSTLLFKHNYHRNRNHSDCCWWFSYLFWSLIFVVFIFDTSLSFSSLMDLFFHCKDTL